MQKHQDPQSGPHCPRYERRLEGDTFHFPNSPCRTRDFTHNKLSETGLFPSSKHGGSSIVFDRKKPLDLLSCTSVTGLLLVSTLGISLGESLMSAANIFLGQTEAL